MRLRKSLGFSLGGFAVLLLVQPLPAQTDRGTAELAVADGKIVVDYGRPQLKGRDPLSWQKDGAYWRMGMNDMTTITTPVDLDFGATRIAKGTYGLWLHKVSADRYELVFNSETSGMGMMHDKAGDVASVALKRETSPNSTEVFSIELTPAAKGGIFSMTWGTTRLLADFQAGQ
jgi:hypothetical protein